MRLLFLTQVLDAGDAVLGFVPRWVEGLARSLERVRVIALSLGDTSSLPANADAREVGREGRVGRFLRYRGFLREALERDGFDLVLAHMVPRYALVAAGPARRAGAGLFLWYTHGGVDRRLRRAVRLCDRVFTASPESLRVEAPNVVVTGHGIDVEHFAPRGEEPASPPRLLSVGRLTPAKDPLTLLAALAILVARGHDLHLDLAGAELAAGDAAYRRRVEDAIETGGLAGRVHVHGAVPYRDIPALYRRAALLVSASRTGSLDKVVLEAMACARPAVTCNEAFPPLFAELGPDARRLSFAAGEAHQLADRVEELLALPPADRRALGEGLRAIVARDHEVDALMARLVREMASAREGARA